MHGTYIVKPGDSLMSIAARVGNVTPAQLARFNKLGMLGVSHPPLFPGQSLYIPNGDELAAQNVRLRHLPGTATRVPRTSFDFSPEAQSPSPMASAGFFSTLQHPSTAKLISPQKLSSSSTGVLERLFVKVKAQRVLLPSKEHIDGILIFTPDAVCFDALATASALNQVLVTKKEQQMTPRIASPSPETISNANDTNEEDHLRPVDVPIVSINRPPETFPSEPVLEAAHPVHDVLALSVCIPIPSLISLNTHGEIDYLLSGGTIKGTQKSSGQANQFILDVGTVLSAETKLIEPSSPKELKFRSQTDKNKVYISLGVDISRITSSCSPETSSTLFEAASSKTHIFRIPLDRLPDIHDILVSATNLAALQLTLTSPSANADETEGNGLHNSMIATALQEMEDVPFELTLKDGKSTILSNAMLKDLADGMPTAWAGYGMRPIFSTAYDGFSLNTLYRKMANAQPNANVLLIQDATGQVFGAILSERMRCSKHFYGTGESCVFQWKNDQFQRYNWTKKNYFFMRGAPDCFLIGAKSGHSAIWFDGALKYGRSEATDTFDNPVLCGHSRRSTYPKLNSQSSSDSLNTSLNEFSPSHSCPSSVPFTIDKLEVWEMVT